MCGGGTDAVKRLGRECTNVLVCVLGRKSPGEGLREEGCNSQAVSECCVWAILFTGFAVVG